MRIHACDTKCGTYEFASAWFVAVQLVRSHKLMNRRHMSGSNPLSIGLQIGLPELVGAVGIEHDLLFLSPAI